MNSGPNLNPGGIRSSDSSSNSNSSTLNDAGQLKLRFNSSSWSKNWDWDKLIKPRVPMEQPERLRWVKLGRGVVVVDVDVVDDVVNDG